jgi:hypothetical protein
MGIGDVPASVSPNNAICGAVPIKVAWALKFRSWSAMYSTSNCTSAQNVMYFATAIDYIISPVSPNSIDARSADQEVVGAT